MHDCAKDILKYHDDEVTLSQKLRSDMRARRDANRDRLKAGLEEAEDPAPIEFVSQGSYAMKTMVQHPDNDYDIDDGVYFEKSDLKGARGAEMSALDVRQMVRDAVDDGSFKKKPEVRTNCVRVCSVHPLSRQCRRQKSGRLSGTVLACYAASSTTSPSFSARYSAGVFQPSA